MGPTPLIVDDTVRVDSAVGACTALEIPITGQMVVTDVLCGVAPSYYEMSWQANSGLGVIQSLNFQSVPCGLGYPGGTTATSGVLAIPVGDWTNNAVFPYQTRLLVYWGCAVYSDPDSMVTYQTPQFIAGIGTDELGSPPATNHLFPNAPLTCCNIGRSMIDVSNCLGAGTGVNAWGGLYDSDMVLSFSF